MNAAKESVILAIFVAFAAGALGQPLDTWHWRNPLPQGNALADVAYLNGEFVAVGDAGTILTSADGVHWTQQNSGAPENLASVTYGNGLFVASGSKGLILTSSDALHWSSHNTGSTNDLAGVAYGAGVFVAVENQEVPSYLGNCHLLVSSNGVDWSSANSNAYQSFNGISYGNGMFVAVGGTDGGDVVISTNGLAWSLTRYHGMQLNGVAFGNGRFVAVGANYYGVPGTIVSSSNGVDWIAQDSVTPNFLNKIAFGQDTFVAVGSGGTILTSAGTGAWEDVSPGTTSDLSGVAYGGGSFVAVGSGGVILQSGDVRLPSLTGSYDLANGRYAVTVFGEIGQRYRIQATEDFQVWSDIFAYTNTQFYQTFVDTSATNYSRRFYRVVTP